MSTEQKVGQLFVMHVYGADADTADNRNVTEYGVADLRGVPLSQRPGRLAAIAHPDHREALLRGTCAG